MAFRQSKWDLIEPKASLVLQWVDGASMEQWNHGILWYQEAHQWCKEVAEEEGQTLEQVCGVTAALSPSCPWDRNLVDARAVIRRDKRHRCTTYPLNVKKARRILKHHDAQPLDILGGLKVRSFYSLVLNPLHASAVCVDRHAARVCTDLAWAHDGEPSKWLSVKRRYDKACDAFREAGSTLGILPHQAQAISWLHFRSRKEKWNG